MSLRVMSTGFSTLLGALGLLSLAACGGGGGSGLSIGTNQLSVLSTEITEAPQGADANSLYESADPVDWAIPLSGGCGGPYVVKLLSGSLPAGISALGGLDSQTNQPLHHLRGVLLEDGVYTFRLEITDTACSPFEFATADFTWTVLQGQLAIVDAKPKLWAPGTYDTGNGVKNPVYPALPDTLFGGFAVHEFVIAGGTPPYTLDVVDDPTNPDDDLGLPLGVTLPNGSSSLVGAPQQIIDGQSFVFSLRATDATNAQSAIFTVQWEITAPPIVFVDATLPDAKCGRPYVREIAIKDGVPPFAFELVQSDVARDIHGEPAVTWQSPLPPIITPATATQRVSAANYPAVNALGPDYRATLVPPEGLRIGDGGGNQYAANGTLAGTPRRRGLFAFYVHVVSTVAPSARGQHNWRRYELNVAQSEPPIAPAPAFGHDPAYTLTGAFSASPPYAPIADAEQGVAVYNPDAATHAAAGLQLRATGGVRKDGVTDAPHATNVTSIDGVGLGQEDGTTPGGGYDWTVNPNPAGDGDIYTTMPPGMALDGWIGVWRVDNSAALVRQQAQALELTVTDVQLPTQVRNSATQRVSFAVGPDKLIITESTTASALTTASPFHGMNDGAQTVRVCLPYTGAPVLVRNLDTGDLSATHSVPSTTGLTGTAAPHTLLSSQDMLRVCVNPAGWWNDVHNLNPIGPRSGIHADNNRYDQYIWGENDLSSASDYSRQPSITAVAMPAYRPGAYNVVTHAPASGVYTDGGKLYPFNNGSYFGVFMVRTDGTIYIPFAISKTQNVGGLIYTGFGDGMMEAWALSGRSQLRVPHMAVSPDGRFAAMKIKTAETNFSEAANTTPIVVFSLTGEKPFGGQTWTIVNSGSNGSTTQGVYLYAPSMVLTNSHLYYVCGNLNGATTIQTAAREHYVYRFQLTNPTTGAVVAGATGTGSLLTAAVADASWTNTSGSPLQTRYQLYYTPLVSGYANAAVMHMDGMNVLENSLCPIPFRVSADGRAVAILAMPDQVTTGVNSQAWHVWVDFQGAGVRRLSSAARHVTGGSARGYTLGRGSSTNTYENWHRYGGPTPHMEISDDGTRVAVVVNRYAGTVTYSSPTVAWPTAREDVIAYRTADTVSWTELPVTGDGAGTNIFSSASSALWRFGCLTFTKDGAGLVFWGGFSSYAAASTTSSYQLSHMLAGTLYGADISTATAISGLTVTGLLDPADGGAQAGVTSYTTSSPYAPTLPNLAYSGVAGVIKPYGGFLSRSRDFMYVVNKGALAAAGPEYPLIGVNIRSTNPSANINGRRDFRGFSFSPWPTRRGFISGTYNYYAQYGLSLTDYPAYRKQGCALQIMPRTNGWVFFASQYQSNGPIAGTASSSYGGPINTTYSYDYASYGGEIEGFNADIGGPIQRLSAHNADTSIRRIHFIEPHDSGSDLAYVYDTYATTNCAVNSEQLHAISGINFGTGGLQSGALTRRVIEGTGGRVSDAFQFGSSKTRLYYAYGTTDESAKALKEATFTSGGGATLRTLTSANRRYNVIHVAR